MSLEDNKAVIRKFFEKANKEERTPVEMCAEGFIAHIGAIPVMDLKAFQGFQVAYYKAFSDSVTVLEDLVAEGDRVAWRGFTKTTHSNDYMGIQASGKQIVVPIIGIARLIDGKIAEWWNSPDRLSWMQQIGALPEFGKAKN